MTSATKSFSRRTLKFISCSVLSFHFWQQKLKQTGNDVEGTVVAYLRVKRPQREANYSPPPAVEVKNEWSFTSTQLYDV
jgi:hypothetical protein